MPDDTTSHHPAPDAQDRSTDPGPPAPDTPAAPTRSRRTLAWAAVGVAALGVAGGGLGAIALADDDAGSASGRAVVYDQEDTDDDGAAGERPGPGAAGERRGHRPGAHGTITSVDGTSFTVQPEPRDDVAEADDAAEAPEPTEVTTDEETVVLDAAEGDLTDVGVGDRVVALGAVADDESVTARRVVDLGDIDPETFGGRGPGGGGPGPRPDHHGGAAPEAPAAGEAPERPDGAPRGMGSRPTAGEVTAVDGTTFTVTAEDGTEVTVTTDDETVVTTVTEVEVADLAEGDIVAVRGEPADGTVAADVVIRGELPHPR